MLWDDDELSPRCRAEEVERQSRSRLTETYGRLNQTLQPRSCVPMYCSTLSHQSVKASPTQDDRLGAISFCSQVSVQVYRLLKFEYRANRKHSGAQTDTGFIKSKQVGFEPAAFLQLRRDRLL